MLLCNYVILLILNLSINEFSFLGIGDWGLGIGDCPIPNPQSPIPRYNAKLLKMN